MTVQPARSALRRRFAAAVPAARRLLNLPVAVALRWLGIRFLLLSVPDRIGHLIGETDYFLRLRRRGHWAGTRAVLVISRRKRCNTALLALLGRHVAVVRWKPAVSVLRAFQAYPFLQIDLRQVVMQAHACPYHAARAETVGDPPTLALTDADQARGRALREALGVPPGRWLVALHCREGGYDGGMHDHRNADVQSYLPAVAEIVARGGWCVRLGDPSMTPVAAEGLSDYARSGLRSDFGDVWLTASCRFLLGSASGLSLLPTLFGVPTACANLVPFDAALPPDAASLGIPKLLLDRDGRPVPFAAIARAAAAGECRPEAMARAGWRHVGNDPRDVGELAVEMIGRLDGSFVETEDDRALQAAFRRLLTPGHYCFHAASRIGAGFLRRHRDLL